jgi:glycine/D-amino acid oxidase-like deaminating enzyme
VENCGSVNIATTRDRMISLERRASSYRPPGVECHLVGPREMEQLHPYLNTEDILGGVWLPKDACVNAGKVSEVLAYLASKGWAANNADSVSRYVHAIFAPVNCSLVDQTG